MKTIFKIPVLLLALMLVVSCGDSKKEEEKLSPVEQAAAYGVKMAELECELMIANELEDWDKMDEIDLKMEKIRPEVEEKMKGWGEDSDEFKAADAAFEKEMESCQEKVAEVRESLRSEASKDAEKAAKLFCEMMAAMKDGLDAANNTQSDEFFKSLDEKYGPSGSASDEDKADFQKEFQAIVEDCMSI